MLTLTIKHCFSEKIFTFKSNIVPRVGERIDLGYIPASTVTDVVYKLEDNIVYIEVK